MRPHSSGHWVQSQTHHHGTRKDVLNLNRFKSLARLIR